MQQAKILNHKTQLVVTKLLRTPQTIHARNLAILSLAAIVVIVLSHGAKGAIAQTDVFEAHSLTGSEIKNNALAQKILGEIESFKKHVLQIQQEQRNANSFSAQVEQNRTLAATLEQEAFASLQDQNAQHTPKAAFTTFVSSINDSSVQNIFWGQFDYMSEKVDEGNAAMKQVLDNGGTWDDAVQAFSKYAAITRDDMVKVNEGLNIQYGGADPAVQSNFYANGTLPDNYIKTPDNTAHN